MKDPNETQEMPIIRENVCNTSYNSGSRSQRKNVTLGKSIERALDSFCEAGGKVLSYLPTSARVLVSCAVAYAVLDGAIYFDSKKHIHQHAKSYCDEFLNLPSKMIDNLFRKN